MAGMTAGNPNHCGGNTKPAAAVGIALVVSVTNTSYAALLAGSLLHLLFDGFHDGLHAVLLDGWLAGSVFLLLVDGLTNGSCAVLLDGLHYCRLVGSPIASACRSLC